MRDWKQAIRYMIFPDSRLIDERTREIDHQLELIKRQKAQTDKLVRNANQPDILRNLVISMTRERNG